MSAITSAVPSIEQMLDVIKTEVAKGVEDYKKTQPEFRERIKSLFSISTDLNNITAQLVMLVMDYAESPQRAKDIIPSIMDTTKDIQTTLGNYEKTKKYPHIYHYKLPALRKQYRNLKQLWNKKIWQLIVIAGLSTRISYSSWASIASEGNMFGSGGL